MSRNRMLTDTPFAVLLPLIVMLVAFIQCAFAQAPEVLQAAKKEGEVVVFGSLENDVAAAINNGFEAKYGIKPNISAARPR